MWRWPARIAVAAVLIGGLSFGWAVWTLPRTDGDIQVSGLAAPAEIIRDANGVPHIFADSVEDAWFALGFVHAQDRLWQMEFMRRLGAGRLAEILGEPGLDADRFTRTMGFYRLARAQEGLLSPTTRGALEAYAAGINAWLEARAAALPPEFVALRFSPEPWRIADTLVWGRLIGYQLATNWSTELYRAQLAQHLPAERIAELWPGDGPGTPVTIESARRAASLPLGRIIAAIPPVLTARSASNAWVLAGDHTDTGAPILANDPHLGFGAPNIWYLARIEAPDFRFAGATVPGVPFGILGHNGHVAWGMTSVGGDTQDVFIETVDPADPARYLAPGGPRPFDIRTETILVKGGEPVSLTVRSTRHGPVISDIVEKTASLMDPGTVLALADTNLLADTGTVEALAAMSRARNGEEFRLATRNFHAPLTNIFHADTDGSIGLTVAGRVPVRRSGDGRFPMDGADGMADWTGYIPASDMPQVVDPPGGRIVNANNRLMDSDYPWLIARDWDDPFRAQRIAEMLEGNVPYTVADASRQQLDMLSVAARDLLPLMLDKLGGPAALDEAATRAAAMLRGWDFRMDRNAPEPLIYAAWLHEALRVIAADELGEEFDAFWRARPRFIHAVLTRDGHWCDDIQTDAAEDCGSRLQLALDRALGRIAAELGDDIKDWRWDDLHRAVFTNRVLTNVPGLSHLADLSIPTGGGDNTIGRGSIAAGARANPFTHVHGAGFRAVYDLSNLENSRFMIAAGQSGNPFSAHYDDLLEPWRDGDSFRLTGKRGELMRGGTAHLALVPLPG